MKVTSVILLFLVFKAKASFFDEFTVAMSSVENAFGKLLNDVVTDVKITVHCTILAMEQVLAINGVGPEPLARKECSDNENIDIETQKVYPFNSARDITEEINNSIYNVNNTLSHVLDSKGHERLEDVKRLLKNESERLTEVSFLLRQELEKISHRMRKKFQGIDLNSDKTSLESVRNDMKILYEVEKNNKNVSEEIGQVLDEAINVLHLNTNSDVKSDKDKINAIMRELEHESNGSNVSKNTLSRKMSLSKVQPALQNSLGRKAERTLNNFKDLAEKTIKPNDGTREKDKSSKTNTGDSFSFGKMSNEDRARAVDQAVNFMKDTARTQKMLDNFFANNQGANLFDNADSFKLKK